MGSICGKETKREYRDEGTGDEMAADVETGPIQLTDINIRK